MNNFKFFIFCLSIISIPVLMTYCIIGVHQVFGQNVTPIQVPVPTPTEPNPNFQYLPQKAAVTVYKPEIGVPMNPAPLQAVPQVAPSQTSSFGVPTDLMGLAAMAGSAIAYVKGHSSSKEAKMGIALAKKVMSGEVRTKEQLFDAVSTMFELAPEDKVAAMEGTKPGIKLKTLQDDKDAFADEAAKA